MSRSAIIILVFVALAFVSVPAVVFFWPIGQFIINAPSCTEDSDAVAYARSLSSKRLSQLYLQMEAAAKNPSVPPKGYRFDEAGEVPGEFLDLTVKAVRPTQGQIMVENCMDHHVYLDFVGLHAVDAESKRMIVLHWGERGPNQGSEVIWSERARANHQLSLNLQAIPG